MKKAFIDQTIVPGLFWDALLKSDVYVPLAEKEALKEETEEPADDKEIPILLGVDSKGSHVLWLFTSPDVMIDYIEREPPYQAFPTMEMLSMIQQMEYRVVLIGPDGLTLELDPGLVSSLSQGKVPEPPEQEVKLIPKNSPVHVGKPLEDTSKLEQAFTALFKTLPNILEGSFIQISDDSGPRLLLGLRMETESRAELRIAAEKIAKAAEGILDKGKTMDITLMDRSLKGAFEKHGVPFYKKS